MVSDRFGLLYYSKWMLYSELIFTSRACLLVRFVFSRAQYLLEQANIDVMNVKPTFASPIKVLIV